MRSIWTITLLCSAGVQSARADDVTEAPAPRRVEFARAFYEGTVTAVTKTSITVQRPGELPKEFPTRGELAAGEFPDGPDSFKYRVTDVLVGDIVEVDYRRVGGVDLCDAVSIRRRPGGKVPPGHYPDDRLFKHHERMQAYQDWEEHGTPFPPKYAPRGPLPPRKKD